MARPRLRAARPLLLAVVVVVATNGVPSRAHAQTGGDARALYQEGVRLTNTKEWAAASRAFQASYERAPSLDALFAWAQVERLGGRCGRAIELYDRFLTMGPTPEQAQAAALGRRRCLEAPPPAPPAPMATTPPPPPPAPSPRWPAWVVTAVGGAAVVTGGIVFARSIALDDQAGDTRDYGRYRDLMDQARLERGLAIGIGAAGLVTLAVGLAWWASASPSSSSAGSERAALTLLPGSWALGGRF